MSIRINADAALYQVEYLSCWLDFYQLSEGGKVVGLLKEWEEAQGGEGVVRQAS